MPGARTFRRSRRSPSTSNATSAAPLAGIARVAAARGDAHVSPAIAVRTGDTPAADRARFLREPSDILITTPESLVFTSHLERPRGPPVRRNGHRRRDPRPGADQARRPPHALARTAGGVRRVPPQRIGLSATQRPLDEVARFLGGAEDSRQSASAVGGQAAKRTSGKRPLSAERRASRRAAPRPGVLSAPRHPLPAGDDRRRRPEEGARAQRPGAGRGHGPADDGRRDPERAAVGRRHPAVHLGGDPPAAARADSRPPVDADLREQPAPGRAAGGRAQRARGRDARPVAPRLDRARSSGSRSRICSRAARFARSSPRPRSSSASTWAPSIWSCRSRRRRRSRAACSGSAAAAIR